MDTRRAHEAAHQADTARASSYPYSADQPPPRRTTYPPQYVPVGQHATYPYGQRPPQPVQPPPTPQAPVPQARRTGKPRRLLGVLAFLVLTGLSLPLHISAFFFIYVEFESPGDPAMAAPLIGGAFLVSFAALFVTGTVAQLVGRFPGRWRARTTFAALSGIVALAVAYLAAIRLF